MNLYDQNNTLSAHHIKADQQADAKVPDGLWRKCPKCGTAIITKHLDQYNTCPHCHFGFRIGARQRLAWLVDDFTETDQDLLSQDPLNFPDYQQKLATCRQKRH